MVVLVWLLLRLIIKSLLVISLNFLVLIWPVGTKETAQESSSSGRNGTTPPFSLDYIIRCFIGVLLPHRIDLVILVLSGMSLISHICPWPWPWQWPIPLLVAVSLVPLATFVVPTGSRILITLCVSWMFPSFRFNWRWWRWRIRRPLSRFLSSLLLGHHLSYSLSSRLLGHRWWWWWWRRRRRRSYMYLCLLSST